MNVLHLTLSFEPGGRRRAIENLAHGGRDYGVESFLACVSHAGCSSEEIGRHFPKHVVLGRKSLLSPAAIRSLGDFVKAQQIELIHSHDGSALFLASLFRLARPGVAHLHTFHRSLGIETATVKGKLRNALALRRCDLVLTASEERREHYLRENWVRAEKVRTVPLGIDIPAFRFSEAGRKRVRSELNISSDTRVFGAIGHFGEEKGLDVVIRSFLAIADRCPGSSLVIVGTGSDEQASRLRELASPQSTRVHFAGYRKDVGDMLSAFDIFVHGARQEAFGLVLAEALANGRPVIATDTGGAQQILTPEVGSVVPNEDPEAMGCEMLRLATDPELCRSMGAAAARRAADAFSIEAYAEKMSELYRSLAAA